MRLRYSYKRLAPPLVKHDLGKCQINGKYYVLDTHHFTNISSSNHFRFLCVPICKKKLISKILCYASSIILCSSLTDVICTSFMHIAPSHSSLKMEYKMCFGILNKSKKSTIFFFVPLQFLASLGARHVMNRRLLFEIIQLLGKNMILFC